MADLFISYSRKDADRALQLVNDLKKDGLSVWIDQHGIDGADSWSKEIVQAIKECKAFVLLLSSQSQRSHNVLKELSIASERRKPILPIELEHVEIEDHFEYPLAGIQRVQFDNYPAIFRSLSKLGIAAGPTHAPGKLPERPIDLRKSLMVLPLEDLSPTQDNGWFADGLSIELITLLSNVRSLRVQDRLTSMSFKGFHGKTMTIAKELDVRYFLEGSVRKFGDQIKITISLLDIVEGEHLWTYTHKGPFDDIFEIQEEVGKKVVEGLELKLTNEEKARLSDKGTINPRSYEFYLKASEYFSRRTQEGIQHAITLLSHAIEADPQYAEAHRLKSLMLSALYQSYERNPAHLIAAETHAKLAMQLNPLLWRALDALSHVYVLQGRHVEAEAAAKEFVQHAPEDFFSHYSLGYYYDQTGQSEKAIPHYIAALRINPDARRTNWNLVLVLNGIGDRTECQRWALQALPLYECWSRLHPDDPDSQTIVASLLLYGGSSDRAREVLDRISQMSNVGGLPLYRIACIYAQLSESERALTYLKRSIEAGFSNLEALNSDPEFNSIRQLPEFLSIQKELAKKLDLKSVVS